MVNGLHVLFNDRSEDIQAIWGDFGGVVETDNRQNKRGAVIKEILREIELGIILLILILALAG